MLEIYISLESIAREFKEVVVGTRLFRLPSGEPAKLRIGLVDGSFADAWISVSGRYSYHWNRFEIDGAVYRYDNAPHKVWSHVTTFPHHFHSKNDFFTKNRVKTALRVGLAIYFFVNGNGA